jgi:deoxycytidylate deaminase
VGADIGRMDAGDERRKQVARDEYYMGVANAVEKGADCLGTTVGAVLVLENRIISTGYNGMPSGFPNCHDQGCVEASDRLTDFKTYNAIERLYGCEGVQAPGTPGP